LLFTIFKWHRLILAFGLVLMVAAGTTMLLQPPVESATAKVLIKTDRGALPISGIPYVRSSYSQEVLKTEAEFFESRVVLLPVARALRAEQGQTVPDKELDQDVEVLRARFVVTPLPNTTVLQAKLSGADRVKAERILRMIVDSYVEQHAVASSSVAFFEQETERVAARLQEAEDRVRAWEVANNIFAIERQISGQLTTVGELENGIRRTDAEIEAARALLDTLTRDIAALPEQSVNSRDHVANPLIARLKADLAAEEAAMGDARRDAVTERLRIDIAATEVALRDAGSNPLVSKLKSELVAVELAQDHDRLLQEKRQQISKLQQQIAAAEAQAVTEARERLGSLRRALAAAIHDADAAARERIAGLRAQLAAAAREGPTVARETVALNPLREKLSRDLAAARTRLPSLISQQDALRDQLREAQAALGELRKKRVAFDQISRDVEVVRALYLQNMKRLNDVRVAAQLEKSQLATVAVIEPPRWSTEGRMKRIALVTLLAASVGLGLGVAAALVLEFFTWSLRTREDVEFYLGVPAVAAIPVVAGSPRKPRILTLPHSRTIEPDGR
jgi:uncharacterized protein involved in exopolysaccharide biosynthesis